MSELLLEAAGRRRSPATMPEFHAGRPPRNKGIRYPADPPTIEEIIAVMRHAGDGIHGRSAVSEPAASSRTEQRVPRPPAGKLAHRAYHGTAARRRDQSSAPDGETSS
jgi:hypothetical protein